MRVELKSVLLGALITAVVAIAAGWWLGIAAAGQTPPAAGAFPAAYQADRTSTGKPDLNGIWQSFTTANVDVLEHDAQPGPRPDLMGVYGSSPGGQGIVEGNEIPYQPWAVAKKKENADKRLMIKVTGDDSQHLTGDPEAKCYRPGIPRATYMPYPFQIFQTDDQILIVYEFKNASRTIYLTDEYPEGPADSWMGWSNGRFEGETLVIDVKQFNPFTWFDRAGNFHSDALHVVERFTPVSPYHMMYEATIEDPKVFTRPWKMRFPLYRRMEPNAQLVDFNCVPFVEDMMYGNLGE
jgi:hypothetical protein